MATTNGAAEEFERRTLVIERIFDAPRDLVFKCWTEPQHLARWLGPKGFTSTILAYDLRPGGSYRFHMHAAHGVDHWQQGIFREIVPPKRLVRTYCWADADGNPTQAETVLTLTFDDLDGKTKLTLQQAVFDSVAARDMHETGWDSSLERLTEYLATM